MSLVRCRAISALLRERCGAQGTCLLRGRGRRGGARVGSPCAATCLEDGFFSRGLTLLLGGKPSNSAIADAQQQRRADSGEIRTAALALLAGAWLCTPSSTVSREAVIILFEQPPVASRTYGIQAVGGTI